MKHYDNYFKIKRILSVVSDADRHDTLARTLRTALDIATLKKMQEVIKQTEKRKEAN